MKLVAGVLVLVVYIQAYSVERPSKKPVHDPAETQNLPTRGICDLIETQGRFDLRGLPEVNNMIKELTSAGDEMAEETVHRRLIDACNNLPLNDDGEITRQRRNLDMNMDEDNPLDGLPPRGILEMLCEDVEEGTPLDDACSRVLDDDMDTVDENGNVVTPEEFDKPEDIEDLLVAGCIERLNNIPAVYEIMDIADVDDEEDADVDDEEDADDRKKRSTEAQIRKRRAAKSSLMAELSRHLRIRSEDKYARGLSKLQVRQTGNIERRNHQGGGGRMDGGRMDGGRMDGGPQENVDDVMRGDGALDNSPDRALDAMCMVIVSYAFNNPDQRDIDSPDNDDVISET